MLSHRTKWPGLVVAALAAIALCPVVAQAQTEQEVGCARSGCHEEMSVDKQHSPKVQCIECHPNVTGEKADEHPDALSDFGPEQMCAQSGCHPAAQEKVLAGPHADSPCEQCHGFIHDEFQVLNLKECRGCHKEQATAFTDSVHAKEVVCSECHGNSHAPLATKENLLAPMSKVMQVETCAECHDDEKVKAFRQSAHGRGLLKAGLDVAPTCSTCHGSHGIRPVDDPAGKVAAENIPETCGSCHSFILAAFKDSVHANVKPEGDRKPPVCTNCHDSHAIQRLDGTPNRLKTPEECGDCHKEEYATYRESFHGKATQLGLAVAATCSDCHTPHRMLGADNPKSSVHPANLQATCEKCHGPVSASFIQFKPHVNPANAESDPTIHYIWLFMTGLLLGTMGFFAIHTLLWTQRSIVAFFKKELHAVHEGDKWVRRFRPVHIWIHLTIIVTFLTLAFTGLPLKFSAEGWAAPLANFVGGLSGARWLHRLAGVITFGYGAFFLGYLIREIIVRRRRSLLWGWQSMVPNKKDLVDLVANIRWFLYLGPRPRLDRWAYWEKFDFFAVFWGIPVIGLSGLTLWFPVAASHILPGWALNIAYIIHSDEALLATGFIFFFHFFHTHLRPEAFPLDPVIFTGTMPLERMKDERPAEYERLVQSGELEKYIVPPPTERVRTLAVAFGVTALSVGVLLGGALMATGIHMVMKYLGL